MSRRPHRWAVTVRRIVIAWLAGEAWGALVFAPVRRFFELGARTPRVSPPLEEPGREAACPPPVEEPGRERAGDPDRPQGAVGEPYTGSLQIPPGCFWRLAMSLVVMRAPALLMMRKQPLPELLAEIVVARER